MWTINAAAFQLKRQMTKFTVTSSFGTVTWQVAGSVFIQQSLIFPSDQHLTPCPLLANLSTFPPLAHSRILQQFVALCVFAAGPWPRTWGLSEPWAARTQSRPWLPSWSSLDSEAPLLGRTHTIHVLCIWGTQRLMSSCTNGDKLACVFWQHLLAVSPGTPRHQPPHHSWSYPVVRRTTS